VTSTETPTRVRLYGHRGACAEQPENTMESFQRAVEIGVAVIETDVHQTRDGHIVVSHDPTGERAAGVDKAIRDCTLREVQSWDVGHYFRSMAGAHAHADKRLCMPTLREVLETFDTMRFNIDIKQTRPNMVESIVTLLRETGAEERTTLASFDTANMKQVRRLGFAGETVLARDEVLAFLAMPVALFRALDIGADAIQAPLRAGPLDLASRRFIAKCHAANLRIDYWTINDPIEAQVLLDRGADGIMTDDPALIAPVMPR